MNPPTARPVEELLRSLSDDELHALQALKKKRKPRTQDKTPEYLTAHELESFFSTITDKRDEAMFRLMYCKALRASEVGRLNMADWNDRDRVLFVHRLKGSRSAPFPMHDRELRALRSWLKVRGS